MLSNDVDISKGLEFFRTVYGPWLLHVTRKSPPDQAIAGVILRSLEDINTNVRHLEEAYRDGIAAVTLKVETLIAKTDSLDLAATAGVTVPVVHVAKPTNVVAFPADRRTPA